MRKAIRAALALPWLALVAALALPCLALAVLLSGRTPETTPEVAMPAVQQPAPVESAPKPVAIEVRPVAFRAPPKASVPIENSSALESVNPRHFHAMLALARAREDAVDACRDRIKLPPVDKLLAWSTVIRRANPILQPVQETVQEISMEQSILFEISTSIDAYQLVSSKVIETWLEFPGQDGSLRRSPFSDASLDRCVESALTGAIVDSPGVVAGETFRIQGHAGEAVYDLR
ncbi:MAG: hypothetical protein ACXWLR_06785 [Myxococcales bacterium]